MKKSIKERREEHLKKFDIASKAYDASDKTPDDVRKIIDALRTICRAMIILSDTDE